MSARTRALQYVYGSMDNAATNCTEYLETLQDEHGIEFEDDDVYLTTQRSIYNAYHQSRKARMSQQDLQDVIPALSDAGGSDGPVETTYDGSPYDDWGTLTLAPCQWCVFHEDALVAVVMPSDGTVRSGEENVSRR